eukprot:TRINITY_DN50134_c0_g1_i1.p1 TRINITY_DN50134_c0_g1~~TRINITY_DN50134_c0_g1_i1.p1  ORF type:complete len:703 (+),score=230.56 TRINITY_DN50134_c0_g1_i1:76-2184(+)
MPEEAAGDQPPQSAADARGDMRTASEYGLLQTAAEEMMVECATWKAAPAVLGVDVREQGEQRVLLITRGDPGEECPGEAEGTAALQPGAVVDELPVSDEQSDQLRARLGRLLAQRARLHAGLSERGETMTEADRLSAQRALTEANASVYRLRTNKAILDGVLAREREFAEHLSRAEAAQVARCEAAHAAAVERKERAELTALLCDGTDDAPMVLSLAALAKGGGELCITREAPACAVGAYAGGGPHAADGLRKRGMLQRYEEVPLSRKHETQAMQPKVSALREQLLKVTEECRQLSESTDAELERMRAAVRHRRSVTRAFAAAQEAHCLVQLALEIREVTELGAAGLLGEDGRGGGGVPADSPAQMLASCREDLRRLDALLRRKRHETHRAEQRGASQHEVDTLRKEQLELHNDVERLREHEAVIEGALRERSHCHESLQRERKRFLHILRQRDQVLREKNDEIAALRRACENASSERTQRAREETHSRMAQIAAAAPGSPASGSDKATPGPVRRPQSAPPVLGRWVPQPVERQRPATSTGRRSPVEPRMPNTASPPKFTRSGQEAMVTRLYSEALERQEQSAARQREHDGTRRRNRKVLGTDDLTEVNNRLYYSIPDHRTGVVQKLQDKYVPKRQVHPMTPEDQKELVTRVYNNSMQRKKETHIKLRKKLILDKEPKFPRFRSREDQQATVMRLAEGRGRG